MKDLRQADQFQHGRSRSGSAADEEGPAQDIGVWPDARPQPAVVHHFVQEDQIPMGVDSATAPDAGASIDGVPVPDDELADDLLERGLEWFVDHWMSSPIFASQKRLGPDALAASRAQRLDNHPDGLAGSLRGAVHSSHGRKTAVGHP